MVRNDWRDVLKKTLDKQIRSKFGGMFYPFNEQNHANEIKIEKLSRWNFRYQYRSHLNQEEIKRDTITNNPKIQVKKISIMAPISCMDIKMTCAQNTKKNVNLFKLSVLDLKQRLKCLGKMLPVQSPARIPILFVLCQNKT